MKRLISFSLLLFLSNYLFSQKTIISGVITNVQNEFIKDATIKIASTNKVVTSNQVGNYIITDISKLSDTLIFSAFPYKTEKRAINIIEGQNNSLNIQLAYDQKLLNELIVLGGNTNSYYVESSDLVAKIPLKNLENPQVYNSIPKQLIHDQIATEMNDVIKNATGVTRLWESTGRGGDGAEYYSMRGFSVQPTLINGVAGINNGVVDPINIESLEVIKGPSGTLFGSPLISYGGLINLTTKKPFNALAGSFGYILGSYGKNRLEGDFNVPLNEKASLRLNTAYNHENSFQDAGFRKSIFVAPSFKFTPSEKITFFINTEFQNSESANAPMIFLNRYAPLTHNNLDYFQKLYNRSFTSNDLTIKNPTVNIQAQGIVKLSSKWKLNTIVSKSQSINNGYYQYFWDFSDGNTFGRYISKRNGETQTTDIQQNLIGDFEIGKVRNRFLFGIDYYSSNIINASSDWVQNGVLTVLDGNDTGFLTQNGVDSLLSTTFEGISQVKNEVISSYISDVINLTPSFSAMASVRFDRFSGSTNYWSTDEIKSQMTVSPKFGLVYQPIVDQVAFFGNYMNGFINQAPVQVSEIDGSNIRMKNLEPEKANQFEFGFKSNIWNNRVSFTTSYYNIFVSNKVMSDPNNFNNVIQGGEVESKGFEFSLVSNPIDGLNIIAGYSFNYSKVVKDDPSNGYIGLRPEEAGPAQLANLWLQYNLQSTRLKGLGVGFGGNYASEHLTLNRAVTGTFTLPSYTILNSALNYKAKNYDLILKADNLLNKKYYSGWSTITPQLPRSISLGFTYKF